MLGRFQVKRQTNCSAWPSRLRVSRGTNYPTPFKKKNTVTETATTTPTDAVPYVNSSQLTRRMTPLGQSPTVDARRVKESFLGLKKKIRLGVWNVHVCTVYEVKDWTSYQRNQKVQSGHSWY